MRSATLSDLPKASVKRSGWPWDQETADLAPTLPDGSPWPRISIVTPSYNRRAFIEESLRSVLLQGYPNLEYVVIDGGSDDGTVEVLERYDPWIAHWVSEPDRGWRDAVNKGLAGATGEIVTFFSSDDVYLPEAFAIVASCWVKARGCGAVVGGFFHVDERTRPLETDIIRPRLPRRAPLDLSLVEPTAWRLHQVATFYSGVALDAVGRRLDERLVYNADRELLYRICRRFPVDLVDAPLAAFRIHQGSLTGARDRRCEAEAEYARMQLSFCTGDADEARRRRIARLFHAKSQLSFARHHGRGPAAVMALLRTLRYQPSRLWTRTYLKAWLRILGMLPARRPEASRPWIRIR